MQVAMDNRKRIKELFEHMDSRFDFLIEREVEKQRDRGKEDNDSAFGKSTWSLPSHIIVFLKNSIEQMDHLKLKLVPWPEFKKVIFEIIDHRIEFAPEINGAINNTYMSMDEHLLIYMVSTSCVTGPQAKGNEEMYGTRDEIELRLIDFLYSLKYYSTRWMRAKVYCEMAGFLHCKSSVPKMKEILRGGGHAIKDSFCLPSEQVIQMKAGVSDMYLDDIEIPASDIYFQEFFFYAYSFLTKERKGFVESKEGYTYLKVFTEHR